MREGMAGYFFNFEKLAYVKGLRDPESCILCGIRDRDPEIDSLLVAESSAWFLCVNLYPYNPGHLLLAPKRHIEDIRELEEEERREYFLGQQLALDLQDAVYHPQGFNIGFNQGRPAGASIEHLHAHIIPRYFGEIGIADLLAGKRVLVDPPWTSCQKYREKMQDGLSGHPFQPVLDPLRLPES